MSIYSDDYDSVRDPSARLIPESVSRAAGAAMFLGLIAAMGVWSYKLGTRDATEVPIIRAMEGPARVQPDDPGGLQAAHQGLEVNTVLAGQPAEAVIAETATLAPPPIALAAEDGPQGELVVPPPAFEMASLSPDGELRVPLGEDPAAPAVAEMPSLAAEMQAEPAPEAAPGAALGPEMLNMSDIVDGLVAEAMAATGPAVVAAVPTSRPRSRPSDLRAVPTASAAPAVAPAYSPIAPVASAAASEVSDLGPGARLVQLGAFDSEAIAREAWARLSGQHGDLLGGKSLYVERTTANARVFYRLRVAGFDGTAETGAMCEALRGRGVDCIPVTLQ